MKQKKITIDFLPATIIIYAVDNIEKHRNGYMRKRWPLLGRIHDTQHTKGVCTHDMDNYLGQYWITVLDVPDPYVLLHEAVHAVDHICDDFGFTDTEFRAYLIQHITYEGSKLIGVL